MNQREKDREYFYFHYRKWREETWILSDQKKIGEHPDYIALKEMGARAIPFIYELSVNEGVTLIKILEEIFGIKFKVSKEKGQDLIKELKKSWYECNIIDSKTGELRNC